MFRLIVAGSRDFADYSKIMSAHIVNGRYALRDKPHIGGMADVYKAIDIERDGCPLAVKIFNRGQIDPGIQAESFRREKQILAELKHPAFPVFGCGIHFAEALISLKDWSSFFSLENLGAQINAPV